jgi:hypothetical protein
MFIFTTAKTQVKAHIYGILIDLKVFQFVKPKKRFCVCRKAISCFFSVLRQFKIVKPSRQPGGKTNWH